MSGPPGQPEIGGQCQQVISDAKVGQKRKGRIRAKRAAKQPRPPKKPKTAYNFFQKCAQLKLISREEKGGITHSEGAARNIGLWWRTLSSEEKQPYEQMADTDRERYNQELSNYLQNKKIEFQAQTTSSSGGKRNRRVGTGSGSSQKIDDDPEGHHLHMLALAVDIGEQRRLRKSSTENSSKSNTSQSDTSDCKSESKTATAQKKAAPSNKPDTCDPATSVSGFQRWLKKYAQTSKRIKTSHPATRPRNLHNPQGHSSYTSPNVLTPSLALPLGMPTDSPHVEYTLGASRPDRLEGR